MLCGSSLGLFWRFTYKQATPSLTSFSLPCPPSFPFLFLAYRLDIDPAYVKKKRAKGIQTDREEIGFMEKRAYGVSWGELKDGKVGDGWMPCRMIIICHPLNIPPHDHTQAPLQMQALPKRKVTLAVVDGKPVA